MNWTGTWRNQYGSTVEITGDADHRIRGFFRTALADSTFFGQALPIVGMHRGDCISFSLAANNRHGDAICSFTGLLRDGKIQTVWHVIVDSKQVPASGGGLPRLEKVHWPHAVMTNADTWERVE